MSTSPEEVQDNVTIYQQGKDGECFCKQWPKFDSDTGKHEHYERCVLEKSPDGTFITCHICFEWEPSKTAVKKCDIVTIINLYQIYNFKQHVESSKLG